MTGIKICGLTSPEDARAAQAAGADFGGVILVEGSPRRVAPHDVQQVFDGLDLRRCGVFVNADFDEIAAASEAMGLDVVQLHGDEGAELPRRLRAELGIEVWKALRPRSGDEFIAGLEQFEADVDGLLLDGWSKTARGGTGTSFPWEEIAVLRHRVPETMRFVVAGGLIPLNVARVISLLDPDVVDVSSGVESAPGRKDPNLIDQFVGVVRVAAAKRG